MNNEVNLFDIEIPKRASHCMEGQEVFSPDTEYYSILVPDSQGYKRHDFCLACWEGKAKDHFSLAAKTAWKARVVSKKEVEDHSHKTRDEKAFYLLKTALENPLDHDWAETFVLALYLARRRILYLRQELIQEDGSVLCIYEVAATEEMLSIKRQSLIGVNIQEIQAKLAARLKN